MYEILMANNDMNVFVVFKFVGFEDHMLQDSRNFGRFINVAASGKYLVVNWENFD